MSLAIQPKPEEDRPRMAVAVDSLALSFKLLCLKPIGEHKEGAELPIYGGNLKNPSAYVPGRIPKDWRVAVEDGDYESEVWFQPPPQLMDEIIFDEHPGQFEILVDNCRVIQMRFPEPEADPGCKVIQHPASYTAPRLPRKAKKKTKQNTKEVRGAVKPGPNQIFFYPPNLNLTA